MGESIYNTAFTSGLRLTKYVCSYFSGKHAKPSCHQTYRAWDRAFFLYQILSGVGFNFLLDFHIFIIVQS